MELMLNLPSELSDIVAYIDRPILLVSAESADIISINQAGIDFFQTKADLVGIRWPSILSLLHVPDDIDMAPYQLPKDLSEQTKRQQLKKLDYIDQENSSERFLEFQIIAPRKGADIWAIIIIDKTDIETSMRSRSDFVALSSHQLRTPLAGIKWSVELFVKRYRATLDEEQMHILDNAMSSINRMNDLIVALLQLSRLETGSLKLRPKQVEIHKLLQQSVENQTAFAKQHKVNLITSFHQSLPQIFLDGTLIGYVFENLITNAIKYSDENSDVTIFLSRLKDVLLLQVTDSGIGIPHDRQHMIFEKFYRDPTAVQHAPDGTGLGLHLCRIIARRSGGDIWFESEEGKGSTFWFTLPLKGVTVSADGTKSDVSSTTR